MSSTKPTSEETSRTQTGSSVYEQYISEQVAREDVRKDSVEKRGLAVVTTAGVLVTLLLGLAALNIDGKHFVLPFSARVSLTVALAWFFASALCAIATNFPLKYEEVRPEDLRRAISDHWRDPPEEAEKMTSLTQIKVLASARKKNAVKAACLYAAVVAEGVAVACVAIAVGFVLANK
jgi:hypothetical protein